MLSPIAAWIAIRDEVAVTPALIAAIIFFWVGGFDILYACQDIEFDSANRLHSIPAKLGIDRALRLAMFSHMLTILMLFVFWWWAGMGIIFLLGCILIAGLLLYEHSLVRPGDLSRVNLAFFHVNAVISFGILVLGCLDLWFGR